jgi:hypothetical protein
MTQMSLTLPSQPLMPAKKSTLRRETMKDFFVGDAASDAPLGACGLPAEPLEPAIVREWQTELEIETGDVIAPAGSPRTDGAGQADLSGFEDDEDTTGGEPVPDDSEEDEFDDFDDIDEDDFDDDFDDDFEEELDDDYEIEIEDEISAEFGLSGVEADIDEIEDIDAIDVIDVIDDDIVVDIDVDDDAGEKE